ncbi:MAG: SEC-C domain-containing protein [Deltaproteobacteria bacterium]|nr:SEC-C domain-containing protein [Deltaproteobacteria bacterium]
MNALELEIVCERDQRCVRRVEFLASHSLWDVHRCIQREFDLDNDHVWSFYLSGEYHDPDTEFGGTPLDGGTAAKARLGELDLEEGMSIAYVFDFGDELRHPVRVVRIAERQAGVDYPRVTHRAGEPPPQYRSDDDDSEDDDADEVGADGAEPEDAAPALPAAEGSPDPGPTLPAELIEKVRAAMDRRYESDDEDADEIGFDRDDLATVAAVLNHCTTADHLGALCEAVSGDVFRWTATVLARGVTAGCAEEVQPLAACFARTAPDTRYQFLWATTLLRLGRRDEALAAMASYQPVGRPESIRHHIRSAMLLADGGDDAAAEGQLRALLGLRWLSRDAREETSRALAPILRRTKRGAEATSMLDELAAKRMARLLRKPLPARRIAPKVGRNDPCPCGSGRKYKKCCGLGR